MSRRYNKDLTGRRFDRVVALEFIPDDTRLSTWKCRCDCGTVWTLLGQSLLRGSTRSCGCLSAENTRKRETKHGHAPHSIKTRTYSTWTGMMNRCEWGGCPEYHTHYNVRGIRVCERWHKYENFLADMGIRPTGRTLDRINNDGNYEPGNCRWATPKQQALNTRRTIRVIIGGVEVVLAEYCETNNLSIKALRSRAVRRGGDYIAALRSIGIEAKIPSRVTLEK